MNNGKRITLEVQYSVFLKNQIDKIMESYLSINDNLENKYSKNLYISSDTKAFNMSQVLARATSEDESERFELLQNRVNFFKGIMNEDDEIEVSKYIKELDTIIKSFNKKYEIYRIGIAIRYFFITGEASSVIIKSFDMLKGEKIKEILVRYNTEKELGRLKINDIVQIQDSNLNINKSEYKGILLLRDINNQFDKEQEKLSNDTICSLEEFILKNNSQDALDDLVKCYE